MATKLPEEKRKQLDGIVSQMVSGGENDMNIQRVVNDFKSKYSVKETPPKKDLLQKATDFATSVPIVGPIGKTIGESIGTAAYNVGQLATKGTKAKLEKVDIPKTIGAYTQGFGLVGGLGAAPTTLVGTVATGAGIGATQSGGEALRETGSFTEGVKGVATGAVVGGALSGAVYGVGKLIGAIGDKITTSVIKPSQADIADGFSVDTIKQYNLGGGLNKSLEKTQAHLNELTYQLNSKLRAGENQVDMARVFKETMEELTDSSKLKGFGANTKVSSGLEALKNEINFVAPQGRLAIPDAQVVKQASGSFGAWQYGRPDPDSKAVEIVYNTFYNKLKTAIEKASPEGVRGINKEISKLIPIQNALLRRIPVADRAGLISLNDMIGLVGSTMHPASLGFTILNLVSKSGVAGNLLSKAGGAVTSGAASSAAASPLIGQQEKPRAKTKPRQ